MDQIATLEALYEDVNGMELSRLGREKVEGDGRSFTYGEIVFDEFQRLLSLTMPSKNEVFYDLGCGTGKAVFAAATFFQYWKKCCGIELLPDLYHCCINLKEKFQKFFPSMGSSVEFINQDLMSASISDADIIFTHSTCFDNDLWSALIHKFNELKSGARLILVTKSIDSPQFETIYNGTCPFTWGTATVTIYKKI